jgi:hypothetical protein
MIHYVISGTFHSFDSENDDVTITFKYKVDEDKFLKDVTVPVWKKIQANDDIMGAMSIAVHNDFVWSDPDANCAYVSWSDDADEANMTNGEHMFFTITSQKVVVGDVDDESDHTVTDDSSDIDSENDVDNDAVSTIRDCFWDNFEPKFSTPNCDGRNYDCHYSGNRRCDVCRDIW